MRNGLVPFRIIAADLRRKLRLFFLIFFCVGQIVVDHHGNFKGHGFVEFSQIHSGCLLQLLQPVDQCIAMQVEPAGSLGYIQIVVKEPENGSHGLFVQFLKYVMIEGLFEEDFTE